MLTEGVFKEWLKKHDFPRLLSSFDNSIPEFVKWKKEYDISNDMMIECRISDFLGTKKISKNKLLYLLEQTFDGKKRMLVAHANMEKEKIMFPEKGESYKLIKTFLSYTDWCDKHKIDSKIFHITRRQGPRHHTERVWLSTGHELLKMGGITAPVNGFGILLRGKHLEFVNLCGLKLEGEIYYGELGNLDISYCAADNILCLGLKLHNLDIEYSTLSNFQVENSSLHNWRLWECNTTGEIVNSKLITFQIFGGRFLPYYKDSYISDLTAEHKGFKHQNFVSTYSNIKKLYSDQGADDLAKEYYIKEREITREFSSGLKFLQMSISYYYWGYGKKPSRVISYSVGTILLCAIIYFCFGQLIKPEPQNFIDSLYFSTVTFTTLGYGDFLPTSGIRIVSLLEAFAGALNIGFLVAGFSNSKY